MRHSPFRALLEVLRDLDSFNQLDDDLFRQEELRDVCDRARQLLLGTQDATRIDIAVQPNGAEPSQFVTVTPRNDVVEHATEAEACAYQRGYRAALGLDEMTGEFAS